MPEPKGAPDAPRVGVAITVKNDPRVVGCVDAVLHQDVGERFRVAVSDNGSTDATWEALRQAFADEPRVTLLETKGTLSASWNAAARACGGDIVARVDADAIPAPEWLARLVAPFADPAVGWTAGLMRAQNRDASLVARYYDNQSQAYAKRVAPTGEIRTDAVPSWNVAYRRDVLERAGFLDPWQGSSVDWDLHKRIRRLGVRAVLVASAVSYHRHPETLNALARKTHWHKVGQYQMLLKYGVREVGGAFLIPAFYAGVLGLLLLGALHPWPAIAAILLLVIVALEQAARALFEGDDVFYARPIFRLVEGVAGILGVLRGVARFGIRRRGPPP